MAKFQSTKQASPEIGSSKGRYRADTRFFWLLLASLWFFAATYFAFTQKTHPDPFSERVVFSHSWWWHPIEFEPELRLPVIQGHMRDITLLPGTKESLVVVGENQLLIYSEDGGESWFIADQDVPGRPAAPQNFEVIPAGELYREESGAEPTFDESGLEESSMLDAAQTMAGAIGRWIIAPASAEKAVSGPYDKGLYPDPVYDESRSNITEQNQIYDQYQEVEQIEEGIYQEEAPFTPAPLHFTQVFFINDKTGWITGSDGSVLKSTDGGRSWSVVKKLGRALANIRFVSEDMGWSYSQIWCMSN